MILLTAEHLYKSYSEKPLIENISFGINEGDKIGIIGINGTGKSTLLKLIAGIEKPDDGSIIKGNGVRIGYLPQNPEFQPGKTVLQQAMLHARSESEEFECKTLLTRLGITDFDAPVETLSGGQRKRVAMAAVFSTQSELLILDEPTNDLDIQTLSILEDYLDSFPGAVIAVSHDRYFLDRVADHLFVFEDGMLTRRIGGYSEYLQERRTILRQKEKAAKAAKPENAQPNHNAPAPKLKFTFKEQREFETIDEVIASLEQKIADTEEEIGRTVSDFIRLQELTEQKDALETELAEKMERWVYLTELAEKIEAQNKR